MKKKFKLVHLSNDSVFNDFMMEAFSCLKKQLTIKILQKSTRTKLSASLSVDDSVRDNNKCTSYWPERNITRGIQHNNIGGIWFDGFYLNPSKYMPPMLLLFLCVNNKLIF